MSIPNPEEFFAAQNPMAYGNHLPISDKWQYRQLLDPSSLPSSPDPAMLDPASPPTPGGSPTVARQLCEFDKATLRNGQGIPSGMSPQFAGLSMHQFLSGENNDASHVLGPSLTRRTRPPSTDSFQSISGHSTAGSTAPHYHGLTVRLEKNVFERRSAPTGSKLQGRSGPTHSTSAALPIPMSSTMLPELSFFAPCGSDDFDRMFNEFIKDDITISADGTTTNVSLANDLPSHPRFDGFSHSLLTGPDGGQSKGYVQQALSGFSELVGEGSDSKHSDQMAELAKFYYKNFKRKLPLLQACEERFKKEVGSLKTLRASLKKRKDEGQYICPIDGVTFTRKQNLKHHIQSHLCIKECKCICGSAFNALSGLKRHQKRCRDWKQSKTAMAV